MNTSKQRTEEIVRRAAAQRAARAKNRRAWLLAVTAGCLLLAVAAYLILFIPYPSALPDISRFSGSPYYPLMQRLNELTYTPPRYQNNFEAWFSGLGGWLDIPSVLVAYSLTSSPDTAARRSSSDPACGTLRRSPRYD